MQTLLMGHLGVIISNGAKRGSGCFEVQARVSLKRPWASCHSLLGQGLTFCQCTPMPASAVPRHSQL